MKRFGFSDVFTDKTGGNPKLQTSEYQNLGLFHIIDQGRGLVAGYTNDESAVASVNPPVIIFGDHTRVLKYVNHPFVLGADGTKVLVPRSDGDAKYLYHYLCSIEIPSAGYSRHYKFLKETSVPFPPLNEQRRVAAILNKVDELRTKRREALAHLDTLTQSIFHSMFPERAWTGATLGAVGEFRYGSSDKSSTDGHECLRIPNVVRRQVDWANMKLVPVNSAELNRLKLLAGDLLFVRSNGNPDFVGRSAAFEPRNDAGVIYASYLIRARFFEDRPLTPLFVHAYLGTAAGRHQLRSGAKTSAGQYNINTLSLGALTIPVPPLELQQTFATRVAAVERLKDVYRKHLVARL